MRLLSFFITLTGVLFYNTTFGQVTANFIASPISGCAPLPVTFTDQSTGTIVKREWDFGDGTTNTTGNLTTASRNYLNPGSYIVKLKVFDAANNSHTFSVTITVFKNPVADFSPTTATKGCAPKSISFLSNSTPGDAAITQYEWDFGDGNKQTTVINNATHNYQTAGYYNVTLVVTDANGCKSTPKTYAQMVRLSNQPTVNFTISPSNVSCIAPYTVSFTNTSSTYTGSNFTNHWSFGNGDTSIIKSPTSITYNAQGTFPVTLTVTDTNGCSKAFTSSVQITSIKANFEPHKSSITGPIKDTVCVGEVVYMLNTSTGNPFSYLWDLGTGAFSTSQINPSPTFNTPGTYTIRLVANKGSQCSDTITKKIVVEDVSGTINVTPKFGCNVPFKVNFSGTASATSGIGSTLWNFGDGASSGNLSTSNNYTANGTYPITFTITSKNGCTKTYSDNVLVSLMDAQFSYSPDKGCAPLTVTFTNTSIQDTAIISCKWIFGDGITAGAGPKNNTITGDPTTSGTFLNPVHTYNNEGEYDVTLIVFNSLGCSDTLKIPKAVKVGTKPTANFSVSPIIACADKTIDFTDLSTPSNKVDEWKWSLGDTLDAPWVTCGPIFEPGTSTDQNPKYDYQGLGYMNVELIVGYRGCYDTLQVDSAVFIKGPFARIEKCLDCPSPNQRSIFGILLSANRFYWDFGDGSPIDSVNVNPTHNFPTNSNYTVTLTAYNDTAGCSYASTSTINIKNIDAGLLLDTNKICNLTNLNLSGNTSVDVSGINGYNWNFGDGITDITTLSSTTHNYVNPGVYTIQLIVSDQHNCKDSISRQVKVFKPLADISSSINGGCKPLPVDFTDNSVSDTLITTWKWTFPDLTTSAASTSNYTFTQIGANNVQLIVTDAAGCKDSIVKTINIADITSSFATSPLGNLIKKCQGDSIYFAGSFTNTNGVANTSFAWDFGNGKSSILQNPAFISFPDTGKFSVSFTATDLISGCNSATTKANLVEIQENPVPKFYADNLNIPCYTENNTVNLFDTTNLSYINSWIWSMSDGWTASGQTPSKTFTQPGVYSVTLTVKTNINCTGTFTKTDYITVDGPLASLGILTDTICRGDTAVFFIDNEKDAFHFTWDFANGTGDYTLQKDTLRLKYNETGWRTPNIVYFAQDSTCKQSYTDSMFVSYVNADYSLPKLTVCQDEIISFTDISAGNSPDGGTPSFTYNWILGDGTTKQTKNIVYAYQGTGSPAVYAASLIVTNEFNCTDTIMKSITVNPTPLAEVRNDTTICQGHSIHLEGNDFGTGLTYSWTNPSTLDTSIILNPIATPIDEKTVYILTVTNQYTCIKKDSLEITLNLVPALVASNDTSIIVGDTVFLFSNNQFQTYLWSPTTGLSCSDCPFPIASPLETTTYTVTVQDSLGCNTYTKDVTIKVRQEFNLAVPTAFTPNGDNNNVISVKGWGIKKLLEFTIYNRWGQVVFTTSDINTGWDGYYNGVLQNTETYVYVVIAIMHDGNEIPKIHKGNITLLR